MPPLSGLTAQYISQFPGVSSIHTTAVVLISPDWPVALRGAGVEPLPQPGARDAAVSIVRTHIERLTIMTVSPLFLYGVPVVPVDMDGPYEAPALLVSRFIVHVPPLSGVTAQYISLFPGVLSIHATAVVPACA